MRHRTAFPPVPARDLRRGLPLVLALALPLVPSAPAVAAFYWVGNGGAPPCTHASLADAIAAAQANATEDVILIVGNPALSGPFTILGGGLQITGGATACGSLNVSGPATLTAPSGSRPLTVVIGPGGGEVTLYNLIVTNQNHAISGNGGAVSLTASNVTGRLRVVRTLIADSTASGDGGGLLVSGGTAVLEEGSQVANDHAANGGGVAIRNGGVLELSGGLVSVNTALGDGGGIHVTSGELRSVLSSPAFPNAISANTAAGDGGGIFVGTLGKGTLSGGLLGPPLYMFENQADLGGGAYVESSAVIGLGLELGHVLFDSNQAVEGGGIFVASGGSVFSDPPIGVAATHRPVLAANQSLAPAGSAILVNGGSLDLYNAEISHHRNTSAGGSVIAIVSDGVATLTGVTLSANQSEVLFLVESTPDGPLALDFVSIGGNTVTGLIAQVGTSNGPALRRTMIDESEPLYASFSAGTPPLPIDCVVTRFPATFAVLPPGTNTSQLFVGDPAFVAPQNGDLHIRPGSAGVDRCTGIVAFGDDADGDPRGFDDPRRPNPTGRTFDAGADELVTLFWDDFELGNLSRWSAVVGGGP